MTNYAGSVAQVTNSVGMTGEASVVTSEALSMLAGDMSSFKNLDMDTVMNNFSSGLLGQSRALYKFGIDTSNATLKQYALANGIKKNVSAMSQSEKCSFVCWLFWINPRYHGEILQKPLIRHQISYAY